MKGAILLRGFGAFMLAIVPVATAWLLAIDAGPIETPATFNPKAEAYPDAIERLEATSQMLVTVVLATLGGAGLLIFRQSSILMRAAGLAVFGCSVQALYYATKLGYASALTLAAEQGDITRLSPLLDNQAMATLIAGFVLGVMVLLAGLSEKSK